jgi:hypothetical protein
MRADEMMDVDMGCMSVEENQEDDISMADPDFF